MEKEEIQNLIRELIEKTGVRLNKISVIPDESKTMWVALEVSEPYLFISFNGEGLHALNYLIHRIIEVKTKTPGKNFSVGAGIIVDIDGFQKKRVENIRAVAHMMGERARYFKSNIEVDPMSAFERRIVHEFLSNATDLKTESTGLGHARRVVIKYIGAI